MKIFASDYDGTIKIDGEVSNRNLQALQMWKEKGNQFGIITGRSSESIMQEIEKYGYKIAFLVCNNGGVIYDGNLHLLKTYAIDYTKALDIIEDIRTMDCNSFVLNNGFHRAKEVVNSAYEDYKYGMYSSEYTVEKIIAEKKICQIVISLNDNEEGKRLAAILNEKYKGYIEAYPNVNCIDIVPHGISKATGLDFVASYFGYAYEDIYTMGDAYNDLAMLKKYQGATLSHTFEDVKAEVNVIVDDVAQYLYALEK
ncbi:MAG: HAD-IIB family hydrolase [Erysipelotrichia bacterium]|nr:HAD-IIB family hydrolase [Erysipelotrichia bacterium]NCC53936.1 HAD-IIB family hydrolase [Erysipelotrichia bacterium]